MSYDLQVEFAKKHSQHFRGKRYKGVKAEIIVPGGHPDYPEALKPEHVIQMMNGGRVLFPFLAANLGCSNVHCADFRVESWIVSEHGFDDYDPEIDRDFYFLIAVEK
jgi:hypothetical protein